MNPIFSYRNSSKKLSNGGIGRYSLIALLVGVIVVGASFFVDSKREAPLDIFANILREFGIVLISVFGISYLYEKLSKEEQFAQFYRDLQALIRQGETNAAMCEALGILEIHGTRRSFEERHSFAAKVGELGAGDRVRIVGRSLIFTMYGWQRLKQVLENGATLELCFCDPEIEETPLTYLAAYSHQETRLTVDRFLSGMRPWLVSEKPPGNFEVRTHRIHLLDSFVEIQQGQVHRATWDLNFGEGLESRRVFLLDSERGLGQNLAQHRYDVLWDRAEKAFEYRNMAVQIDTLSSREQTATEP